jgi:tRNA threonylcarbamoyl adenosine modification protein YeaZ
MLGLAIHTSSPELGLALRDLAPSDVRSRVWPLGRDLMAYLHTSLAEFIQPHSWQDVAYIAVAKGPGGFTGTRIGVVVARTLAQQLAIPLFGVSSLEAIAQHAQTSPAMAMASTPYLAVVMRAQRGEVFGAIYRLADPVVEVVLPEALYSQADWDATLASWEHPYHLIPAEGGLAHTVTSVMTLAHRRWQAGDRPDWQSVLPFYGQHPVQL